MQISTDTSPDAAIKIAYDFARALRRGSAREQDLSDDLHEWISSRFRGSRLLRYMHAGFTAGYLGQNLPWVKDIDGPTRDGAPQPGAWPSRGLH